MKFPTLLGHGAKAEESGAAGEAKPRLDVAELREKLDTAEEKIRGLINITVPEVKLELPRCAGPVARGGGGGDLAALLDPSAAVADAGADVDLECGGLRERLLDGGWMDELAKAKEFVIGVQTEMQAPLFAAISSLVLVVASAFASLGPVLATVVTACASTSSFAFVLYQRAVSVRSKITGHLDSATTAVLDSMDRATQTVAASLTELTEAIDDMVEQQQPALQKIEELEDMLQVDIPDPSDIKQPLEECGSKIDGYLRPLVQECRDRIDQLLSSAHFTKVVMNSNLFFVLTVVLPVYLVLLSNIALALVQVWSSISPTTPSTLPSSPSLNATVEHLNVTSDMRVPAADDAGIAWAQYLHPWLSQMVAMAVQVLAGILVTQEVRVRATLNAFISSMEETMNGNINASIAAAANSCFEEAFAQVRERCDAFFPKFKDILERVEQAEELAQKAGRLADVTSAFKW